MIQYTSRTAGQGIDLAGHIGLFYALSTGPFMYLYFGNTHALPE